MHHDDGPHVWFALHRPEQQSVLAVHELPSLLHDALSGTQTWFEQLPPQHWPFEVHAPLSLTQLFWHTPWTQLTEQQSVFAWHEPPAIVHTVGFASHVLIAPQMCEQH